MWEFNVYYLYNIFSFPIRSTSLFDFVSNSAGTVVEIQDLDPRQPSWQKLIIIRI